MEAPKDLSINSFAEELRFREGSVYEAFMKQLNECQQGLKSKHDFFCNMVTRLQRFRKGSVYEAFMKQLNECQQGLKSKHDFFCNMVKLLSDDHQNLVAQLIAVFLEASKDLSINSLAEELRFRKDLVYEASMEQLNECQQGLKSKHDFFCDMVKPLSDDHQDLVAQLKTVYLEASKDLSINSLAEELIFRKGSVYEAFMEQLNECQQGLKSKHDFFCNMVKLLSDDHQDLVAQLKTVFLEASKDLSINSLAEELRFCKDLVYEAFMEQLNECQQGLKSKHDFFCNMVKPLSDDHQDLVAQLNLVIVSVNILIAVDHRVNSLWASIEDLYFVDLMGPS